MKQTRNGLYVPDEYREPEPRKFPPELVIPSDTKHPSRCDGTSREAMTRPGRFRGVHWGDHGIETYS